MVSVVQIHTLLQADRRVKQRNAARNSEILSGSVYKNVLKEKKRKKESDR
jgi:hypothetical protein